MTGMITPDYAGRYAQAGAELATAGAGRAGTGRVPPNSSADDAIRKSLAIQSVRSSIMLVRDCFRIRYQWFAGPGKCPARR
jgi:hypothetical protein